MKYFKLYILLLGLGLLTSCSNDDDPTYNTADVTVSFDENTTVSVLETAGVYRIPLTLKGTSNGLVQVHLKAVNMQTPNDEGGVYETKEDVDYYVTEKRVNYNVENGDAYVEVKVSHDYKITGHRKFKIELTDAKGAKIGNSASCEITIEEVDDQLYYRMMSGTWIMTGVEISNEKQPEVQGKVILSNGTTASEQILNANEKFLCNGFFEAGNGSLIASSHQWSLKFDEKNMRVSFKRASEGIEGIGIGDYGLCTIYIEPIDNQYAATNSEMLGEINVDDKGNPISITFNRNDLIGMTAYSDVDEFQGQAIPLAGYANVSLTFVPRAK